MLTRMPWPSCPRHSAGAGGSSPTPCQRQFLAGAWTRHRGSERPSRRTDHHGPRASGTGKGFDLLIEAFALIADSWPTARLVIWGEGDERGRARTDPAPSIGLDERVGFPGNTTHPEDELLSATVFVLSSRKEGLPMVLIEAMAMGRAVVACDCDHGPRDIIRDGVDGVLVPPEDAGALAGAIDGLLRDEAWRTSLAGRAVEVRASSRWRQSRRNGSRCSAKPMATDERLDGHGRSGGDPTGTKMTGRTPSWVTREVGSRAQIALGARMAMFYLLAIGARQDQIALAFVALSVGMAVLWPAAGLAMFVHRDAHARDRDPGAGPVQRHDGRARSPWAASFGCRWIGSAI